MSWEQKIMLLTLEKKGNDTAFKDIKVGCKKGGYKLLSVSMVGGRRKHAKEDLD